MSGRFRSVFENTGRSTAGASKPRRAKSAMTSRSALCILVRRPPEKQLRACTPSTSAEPVPQRRQMLGMGAMGSPSRSRMATASSAGESHSLGSASALP
ncbi:hypothetical protein DIPPA_27988 [Diplonema papillatum]|nr:hypothetical protein DIPPA_27988 [Diplonema papillatum]